jgi:hypothetical protein
MSKQTVRPEKKESLTTAAPSPTSAPFSASDTLFCAACTLAGIHATAAQLASPSAGTRSQIHSAPFLTTGIPRIRTGAAVALGVVPRRSASVAWTARTSSASATDWRTRRAAHWSSASAKKKRV